MSAVTGHYWHYTFRSISYQMYPLIWHIVPLLGSLWWGLCLLNFSLLDMFKSQIPCSLDLALVASTQLEVVVAPVFLSLLLHELHTAAYKMLRLVLCQLSQLCLHSLYLWHLVTPTIVSCPWNFGMHIFMSSTLFIANLIRVFLPVHPRQPLQTGNMSVALCTLL